MYVMVLYDISENYNRRKVAEWCLDMGLVRLQRSVFIGRANPRRREELLEGARHRLGDSPGLIHVLPLHRPNLEQLEEIHVPAPPENDDAEDTSKDEPRGVA